MNDKVLMIVTSHGRLGDTGKATGFWAEELAVPYYRLTDAGVQVEIASPIGGPAPIDPGSVKPTGQNHVVVERFLADADLQTKLKRTHAVHAMDASTFDAVFFPGGHGTMWDLPTDPGVKRAVEAAYNGGKLIASVCHGAAGLVSGRRKDGKPIVEGYRINSFTDAEETAVGLAATVPFLLEARLREIGANFESASMWQAFAVRDRQFVTGQNPQSSALVADHLLTAMQPSILRQAA